jgi:hypothetical protein
MTVKELIEYLETLPPETVVKTPKVMESGYGGYTKLQDPVINDTIYFYESPTGHHTLEMGEES